jgi:hypothetical protein
VTTVEQVRIDLTLANNDGQMEVRGWANLLGEDFSLFLTQNSEVPASVCFFFLQFSHVASKVAISYKRI